MILTDLPFVYPNSTNTPDVLAMIDYVNYLTDGIFGVLILIMIAAISIFATINAFSYEKSFGAAIFITAPSAIFLRLMNLISSEVFGITIFLCVGGIIALALEAKKKEVD